MLHEVLVKMDGSDQFMSVVKMVIQTPFCHRVFDVAYSVNVAEDFHATDVSDVFVLPISIIFQESL
jgi:hypothetical protein